MKRKVISFDEAGFQKRMRLIEEDLQMLNEFVDDFNGLEVGPLTSELFHDLQFQRHEALKRIGQLMADKLVAAGIPRSSSIVDGAIVSVEERADKVVNHRGINLFHKVQNNVGYFSLENGTFVFAENLDGIRAQVRQLYEKTVETKGGFEYYELHQQLADGLHKIATALQIKPWEILKFMANLFDVEGERITPKAIDYDLIAANIKPVEA